MQQDGNCVMRKGTPGAALGVIWSTDTHLVPVGAKNVLHFVIDDLRPEMNVAYGQTHMVTPAFDRLAREGLTFDNAYCQIAVCAPSRNR
jgi:arylsulfatase A-like enzyme